MFMSTKLNVKINKGIMVKGPKYRKPFIVLLDNNALGDINWGEQRSYTIPTGTHNLTLKYRPVEMSHTMDFQASEGGTVFIESYMDREKGKFILINKSDGTTSDNQTDEPSAEYIQAITKKQQDAMDQKILGGCATAGAIMFVLLNFITRGVVPGGFIGGFIGAAVGGVIGAGINGLRRRNRA
jgi:hypothetical protein